MLTREAAVTDVAANTEKRIFFICIADVLLRARKVGLTGSH
jgi:hypothetical protein